MRKLLFLVLCLVPAIFIQAQTITLTYDAYGNRLTKSVVGTYPNPVLTGDSVVCQGDSAHFYASGGTGYLWNNGSTQSAITVPADSTRWYWVKVFNALGCDSTVKHLLTVKPVPVTGNITGDSVVYTNTNTIYYVPNHTGSFYDWSITAGSSNYIDTGYGHDQISIHWGNVPGIVSVQVTELVDQCSSSPVSKQVTILEVSAVPVIANNVDIKVFPNPTDNGAWVRATLPKVDGILIIVTNSGGKQTGRKTATGKSAYEIRLEKELFPVPGIYYINVNCGSDRTIQKLTVTK